MKAKYVYCENCNFEEFDCEVRYSRTIENGDLYNCPYCGEEIYVDIENEKDYKTNTIEIVKSEEEDTIPMNEMKPLQIGIIKGSKYNDHVVMRTASSNNFEVMDLTESGIDKCWYNWCRLIKVKLLPNAVLKVFI
jgi:polynucleotide 5'-kinase involved in rRNA processing